MPEASIFEHLKIRMAGEGDLSRRAEVLILGLSEIVKTASNDQNVQRLSRELRAAAGDLAGAVSAPVRT